VQVALPVIVAAARAGMPPTSRLNSLGRLRLPRFAGIWFATALLFAVSPLLAPGSLGIGAIQSMLPYAALLAIVAIGQTLVIQQRGLDLSVAGTVTLATVIVTRYPDGDPSKLAAAIALVLLACAVSGLISGIAITRFGITPLVATLGVNALLLGAVYQISRGSATTRAVPDLSSFAVDKTLGIPNTVLIAIATIGLVALLTRATVIGRRFVAVGASPQTARAAGIRVRDYQVATYVAAGLAYGGAGILLAGFLRTPNIDTGNAYLLPSIAAVVLAGMSLAGGAGSVVAVAMGALFLTQLEQVVVQSGAGDAWKLVIEGAIIAAGMAVRTVPWRSVWSFLRGARERSGGPKAFQKREKVVVSSPKNRQGQGGT
jgi:ribose transport system permease protein